MSLLILARCWCRYGVESKCSFTTGNGTEYKVFDAGELLLPLRHQHHRLAALRLLPLQLRRCSRLAAIPVSEPSRARHVSMRKLPHVISQVVLTSCCHLQS